MIVERTARIGRIGFELACREGDLMAANLDRFGIWERHISLFLLQACRPGSRVIDVGANAGYYSLLCHRLAGSEGRVLAVEPDPGLADLAAGNLARGGADRVELARVALAARPGSGRLMTVERDSGTTYLAPGSGGPVAVETLDALCRDRAFDPDLLKIDVEGLDLEVLAGGIETLARARPTVIVEFSPLLWSRGTVDPRTVFGELHRLGYRAGFFVGSDGFGVVPTPYAVLVALAESWIAGDVHSHLDLLLRPGAPAS